MPTPYAQKPPSSPTPTDSRGLQSSLCPILPIGATPAGVDGPLKRERRWAVDSVVGAVHDEPRALGQCAELPDDQFLRPVVVQDVAGLEGGRIGRVVVVGEL